MVVGFIGFGEAASSIALGLHKEGIERIVCCDAMQNDERFKEAMDNRVDACQGQMLENTAEVCRKSDVVISAVPSNYAVTAAEHALDGIKEGQPFMDVSTATPIEKKKISGMVKAKGGLFVDGAMMGALLKDKHQVPMLLSGDGAAVFRDKMEPYHMRLEIVDGEAGFRDKMEPYHMRLEIVDGEAGTATSIKFIRSITAKGLSCLLIESLQAAQRFGVEQTIVDSFIDTFGPDFIGIINGYISGAIIHAERREHELENVVNFLKSESLPYTMAEATRLKLQWLKDIRVKDNFEHGVARDWKKVLEGWKL